MISYSKTLIAKNGRSQIKIVLSVFTTRPEQVTFKDFVDRFKYNLEQICGGDKLHNEENWPLRPDYSGQSTCMYSKYGNYLFNGEYMKVVTQTLLL